MRIIKRVAASVMNRVGIVNERPIIVLGNQKSGTSAIAHLLADFGGLSKTVDIPPLWPPAGVAIMRGEASFAEAVRRNRRFFSRHLVKEPMMTFFADQVVDRFPEAKYLFVVRDPRDNIRSILNRRDIPGHLERLSPHEVRAQGRVAIDAGIWGGEEGNYIDVLAHRWVRAVSAYRRFANRMHLLKYEDFVADKPGTIAAYAARLGISRVGDISGKLDVQFQPRGNRSVRWLEFFGARNLARIEQVCAEEMARFGYPLGERPHAGAEPDMAVRSS